MNPVSQPNPPILIRPAVRADTPGMVRVRVDAQRKAYRGLLPDHIIDEMSYEQTEVEWQRGIWEEPEPGQSPWVAQAESGKIVGVMIAGPQLEDMPDYPGEIYVLYIHPDNQGQGIGRKLMETAAHELLEKGITKMMLSVLAGNDQARGFYDFLGGKVLKEFEKEYGGEKIRVMFYGWDDIHCLVRTS